MSFSGDDAAPGQDDPEAPAPAERQVTILVCSSCRGADGSDARPRPGERLARSASRAAGGSGVAIHQVECLGNCKRRLSAALLLDGGWSYVFGDLSDDSAEDLVAGAHLFRSSDNGLLPWRGRPDSLKRGLIARIPPLTMFKDQQ